MTKWVWAVALLMGATVAGAQQGSRPEVSACGDPAVVKAAQQIVETWKAGYNGGDPKRVSALYTEDATYLTQHFATGIVDGRRAIEAYVKLGTDAGYKIESLQVLKVGCAGEMAYAITRYESMNNGQRAFGVNLVVLRRVESVWKIVAHEAAVPDPATAVKELGSRE